MSREVFNSFDNLLDVLRTYNVIILEGFEMVGKSTMSKLLRNKIANSILYRPNYEDNYRYLTPDQYYIVGLASFEALSQVLDLNLDKLILDRGLPSNIVYSFGKSHVVPYPELHKIYKRMTQDLAVAVVHCNHQDLESAITKYDSAIASRKELSEYDTYLKFEDYYEDYTRFEKYYDAAYDRIEEDWDVFYIDPLRLVKEDAN